MSHQGQAFVRNCFKFDWRTCCYCTNDMLCNVRPLCGKEKSVCLASQLSFGSCVTFHSVCSKYPGRAWTQPRLDGGSVRNVRFGSPSFWWWVEVSGSIASVRSTFSLGGGVRFHRFGRGAAWFRKPKKNELSEIAYFMYSCLDERQVRRERGREREREIGLFKLRFPLSGTWMVFFAYGSPTVSKKDEP